MTDTFSTVSRTGERTLLIVEWVKLLPGVQVGIVHKVQE